MIHQFDHRANSVRVNPESTHNPYLSEEVSEAQHADPEFLPQSQYWVPAQDVEPNFPQSRGYALGFRDITRPTDVRTVIASIVPWAGYGNTSSAARRGFRTQFIRQLAGSTRRLHALRAAMAVREPE